MKWVKKMWYINTMEYYSTSKRDRFESFVVIWMNLEPVIQSEVSQKEESKDVLQLERDMFVLRKWYLRLPIGLISTEINFN